MKVSKLIERVRSERGNVGVLMALFLMVAIGSLAMTWNTVQLSKEKMRLQAAADSAALSACVWQARGMNAVQNINDDMYILLSISTKLIKIATPMQAIGVIFWKARYALPFGFVFRAIADAAFVVAMLLGGSSAWMVKICTSVLRPLGHFYAKTSALLGFWGSQQLAAQNGATRLVSDVEWSLTDGEVLGKIGLFAAGTSSPIYDLFVLPLEEKSINEAPWVRKGIISTIYDTFKKIINEDETGEVEDDESSSLVDKVVDKVDEKVVEKTTDIWRSKTLVPSTIASIHTVLGTGSRWVVKPYVTPIAQDNNKVLPSPVLFFVRRSSKYIETFGMNWWDNAFGSRPAATTPMMAVAAAQCITGDVIPHSKPWKLGEANQRPAGFGTGATARLIPVGEYAKLRDKEAKVKGGIFH